MNVHEFQAKQLFAQFGVPVPRGKEITSPEAATAWANELNTPVFVVKAQIHAGGRGKAGGVKITKDKGAVAGIAKDMLTLRRPSFVRVTLQDLRNGMGQ